MNNEIFKAYDIRGIYPTQINEDMAQRVGEAFGTYIGSGKKIIVGFDVRTSSPNLHERLLKGLSKSGVRIMDAGMVPTPVIYFGEMEYKLDGGVMVTASHNPAQWNGIKMYRKGGISIGLGSGLEEIEKMCNGKQLPQSRKKTTTRDIHDSVLEAYKKSLVETTELRRNLIVGIDPGTGAFSGIAREVFQRCGAKVYAITDMPHGTFTAMSPEPKDATISQLKELVVKKHANFGVAFDSDGDRSVFVDEKGTTVSCDDALSLFIINCLKPGDRAVYEVSCSKAVDDVIRQIGGIPIVSKTGRGSVLNEMKKHNAKIGGENSGHVYFSEIHMDDDGLFAALKMAEILCANEKTLSQLTSMLPKYATVEKAFNVDERYKFATITALGKNLAKKERNIMNIDGVKAMRPDGWFLLRASNTSPIIRLIAESDSGTKTRQLLSQATTEFKRAYEQARIRT